MMEDRRKIRVLYRKCGSIKEVSRKTGISIPTVRKIVRSQEALDIDKLTTFLLTSEGKEFETLFKGIEATNFTCNSNEKTTQQWISKALGDTEKIEPQENISYGAHSTRDGISLSRHTRQKPLVMPTELSQLENLESYVKLPGDYPCTKLQMTYQTPPASSVPAFLLKPEKKKRLWRSASTSTSG
jgi:hypothetical protein